MKKTLVTVIFIIVAELSTAQFPVFQWARQLGGASTDIGLSVSIDASGNVYTTGYFSGTVDFDPGSSIYNLTSLGGMDIFVSKLDVNGNFVWAKNMGGGTSAKTGNGIVVDATNNVYVTGFFLKDTVDFDPGPGTFTIGSVGANDIFIFKLDPLGNLLWAKSIGGVGGDEGNSISIDVSGNVYTTGIFSSTVDFDPGVGTYTLISKGVSDIFVSKLDGSGNFVWAKSIGDTLGESGNSIAIDTGGNVYYTGHFRATTDFDPGIGIFNLTSAGAEDIFISKLDANGNFVWADQIKGPSQDYGYSVAVDLSGNVYSTGTFFGAADFDPGIGTFTLNTSGQFEIYVLKLDPSGNFLWAKNMGGSLGDYGRSIALDQSGNVYSTGYFNGTADFDPGPGNFILTSPTYLEAYISKLDVNGNFVWAGQLGGAFNDIGTSIAVNATGDIYTTGYFSSVADFDPSMGTYTLTTGISSNNDIFVHKTGSSTIGVEEIFKEGQSFHFSPNPNAGVFALESTSASQIIITNILGEEILNQEGVIGKNKIDIQNQASGIYFVKIISSENKEPVTAKIIKQ